MLKVIVLCLITLISRGMRLGVVLTSHDTVAGASLSTLVSEQLDAFRSIDLKIVSQDEQTVENQYGKVTLVVVVLEQPPCYPVIGLGLQHTIVFLQRHRPGDEPPPHAINHHANVRALADMNVESIIATTCVGTLVASFPPGRVGLARQYIDFTGVPITFHQSKAVFTSVTQPFDESLNKQLEVTLRRVQELPEKVRLQYTYWLSCGPQYETEAEVTAIDRFGGEVCGFTMPREAKVTGPTRQGQPLQTHSCSGCMQHAPCFMTPGFTRAPCKSTAQLCAELGIPYSALLIATNWAAGRHPCASRVRTAQEIACSGYVSLQSHVAARGGARS